MLSASRPILGLGLVCLVPEASGHQCLKPTFSLTREAVECLGDEAACAMSTIPWDTLTLARWSIPDSEGVESTLSLYGTPDTGGEEIKLNLYFVEE